MPEKSYAEMIREMFGQTPAEMAAEDLAAARAAGAEIVATCHGSYTPAQVAEHRRLRNTSLFSTTHAQQYITNQAAALRAADSALTRPASWRTVAERLAAEHPDYADRYRSIAEHLATTYEARQPGKLATRAKMRAARGARHA